MLIFYLKTENKIKVLALQACIINSTTLTHSCMTIVYTKHKLKLVHYK